MTKTMRWSLAALGVGHRAARRLRPLEPGTAAATFAAAARRITSHHRQHAGRADAVRRLARDDAAGAVPAARAGDPQPRLQRRRDRHAAALEELRHAGRVAERRRPRRSAATRRTGFDGTNTKADVVFAFFGYNESYAGQEGLDGVQEAARRLDHAHAGAEVQRQVGAADRASSRRSRTRISAIPTCPTARRTTSGSSSTPGDGGGRQGRAA